MFLDARTRASSPSQTGVAEQDRRRLGVGGGIEVPGHVGIDDRPLAEKKEPPRQDFGLAGGGGGGNGAA